MNRDPTGRPYDPLDEPEPGEQDDGGPSDFERHMADLLGRTRVRMSEGVEAFKANPNITECPMGGAEGPCEEDACVFHNNLSMAYGRVIEALVFLDKAQASAEQHYDCTIPACGDEKCQYGEHLLAHLEAGRIHLIRAFNGLTKVPIVDNPHIGIARISEEVATLSLLLARRPLPAGTMPGRQSPPTGTN